MYNFDWHREFGGETSASAIISIKLLREFLAFDSVLDIGCGDGRWLSAFAAMGVGRITGVDGPWTDKARLEIPADRLVVRDLAQRLELGEKFDLAVSLEVAEHVETAKAEVFVENLTRHSDAILFGAAIPFQGGFRHLNEQWPSYWAALFAAQGFAVYDPIRSQIWGDDRVSYWYRQNMLLYVKRERADLVAKVAGYMDQKAVMPMPLDVVHPQIFKELASYQNIAYPRLLKAVPGNLHARFRNKFDALLKRSS